MNYSFDWIILSNRRNNRLIRHKIFQIEVLINTVSNRRQKNSQLYTIFNDICDNDNEVTNNNFEYNYSDESYCFRQDSTVFHMFSFFEYKCQVFLFVLFCTIFFSLNLNYTYIVL